MVTTAEAFKIAAAHHRSGQVREAESVCRQILQVEPHHADSLHLLGLIAHRQGQYQAAIQHISRAIRIQGNRALFHCNLGEAYRELRMFPTAVQCYQQALRLDPLIFEAHNNLGLALRMLGRSDEAMVACERALQLRPESAGAHNNVAALLGEQGDLTAAIAHLRRSIELRPDFSALYTDLLCVLNYHPAYDRAAIFAEHLNWARLHAEPLTAQAAPHANDATPDRRLRIGYVSPFFRRHAVNYFTEPMILAHDRQRFEIFCYSDVVHEDAVTARLKAAADVWRDMHDVPDRELAERVRDDRIDILVDLTGHIVGGRLLAFARKPAPIQVTYMGYQNTTGMSAMDYRLTDEWADPPGLTDPYYTEKLVRLPRSFFCYKPPEDAPAVTPLPALAPGHVTFGSFNNFQKVTPQVISVWLEILSRVPNSRLLVLASSGGSVERRLHALAQEQGVASDRVHVVGRRSLVEYLRLIQQADIALDPFPFNGHTTTCDSIWMGVPVVMLAGNTYASRFGGSVLANVGLEHLIAETTEQYVEIAVDLASDLQRLARLRSELRPRMAESALLDFQGFTRNVEQAYRQMWQQWCARARGG